MIEVMQSGSVIYDLAASQGGNSELTKVNQIIDSNGVKIMGEANILKINFQFLPLIYMQKICIILLIIYLIKIIKFEINVEDEIIQKTMVK